MKVSKVARKKPRCSSTGAFLFRYGKVAYALGWLPPIRLRPAICRCSGKLHPSKRRVKTMKINPKWHTPFLYLYRGGSVANYTTGAEMSQEAIFPCLLHKSVPPMSHYLMGGGALKDYPKQNRKSPELRPPGFFACHHGHSHLFAYWHYSISGISMQYA